MNQLKWRNCLKPVGCYNRSLFLFWFFIPIIVFTLIFINTWQIEIFLIRLSYHTNLLLNNHLIINIVSGLLILFLIYLLTISSIKRCFDIGISGAWIVSILTPIIGISFLALLLLLPSKASNQYSIERNWWKNVLRSLPVVFLSLFLIIISFVTVLYALAYSLSRGDATIPLRLWNQTNQTLNIQIIREEDSLYQGYPSDKLTPNQIRRNENLIPVNGHYTVIANNTQGETIYTKDYSSLELSKLYWVIIIPIQTKD